MPEGPEIRRVANRIHKAVAAQETTSVIFGQPPLRPFGPRLQGQQVIWVKSRGKALLTNFEEGLTVYSHNQLYGRWYIQRAGKLPRTSRTLRFAIHTERYSALLYSASDIQVLTEAELPLQKYLARLGPDALDDVVHWRDVLAQLQSPVWRGRSLGALYLDQGFVAGIGNYLRSEILHFSGLHPADRPVDLSLGKLGELSRYTLLLTRRALATAGVTNVPQRVKRLQREGLRRSRFRFAIFDRQGEPCYTCGTEVQRIEVNSRRLYLCSRCQPRRRV